MAEPIRRLIVCFDGTWNTPEDNTNVIRLFQAVADENTGAREQLKFYDAGVGTEHLSQLRGGMFGKGISENVRQGYAWLCRNFDLFEKAAPDGFVQGSEIYLFGFSRGAFTARSLGGLISRCGLIRAEKLAPQISAQQARSTPNLAANAQRDDPIIRTAWEFYRRPLESRDHAEALAFRAKYSHDVRIKMIGVWDTVGALGVPTSFKNISTPIRRSRYQFHDLGLSPIVENAYHAVAIDEHRADFNVALWDRYDPAMTHNLEQRWFPGAHSNVGGGYEDDCLADISLHWMVEKAASLGLRFTPEPWADIRREKPLEPISGVPSYLALRGDEYADPVRDSYAEFASGLYRRLPGVHRYVRPILTLGVNEWIDQSAQAKWNADPYYRPMNLALAGSERRRQQMPVAALV